MAQVRQFGHIPDLDDAPDIYETPELTDDTSTVPASTTVRSPSSASSYDDAQEDTAGIDRRRVGADEARSRFEPTRVSARDVDFSGRLGQRQKSYRVSSRRTRFVEGVEELGDFSDEEDEPVEHKLARLRQEIEEVKAEMEAKDEAEAESGNDTDAQGDGLSPEADVQALSELLDSVYASARGNSSGAEGQYQAALQRFTSSKRGTSPSKQVPAGDAEALDLEDYGISVEQRVQILSKASEVDQRLTALETALGIDGSTLPEFNTDASRPIFHTLNSLDRQLSMLASPSSSDTLDTASHRIRQLTQEADRLAERQRATSPTLFASASARDARINGTAPSQEPESNSKINALFGTLPTIEHLAPSLPMVLERLRTLRLIHASAGDASTTLDELEKRQVEQATEIERWQEALSKVESSISEGENVLTTNVKLVSEWVKDLEARVGNLS